MSAASTATKILALASLLAAAAASGQTYEASIPDTTIAVEPGESVDIPVTIVNHDTADSPELHLVLTDPIGDYTFEQRSLPDCGPIEPSTTFANWTESTIAPIPAGASRTCTIRATRDAGEIDNGFVDWLIEEGGQSWIRFEIGTFVDIAVGATKLGAFRTPDGMTHATYRVEASNASAIDVENVVLQLGPACVPNGVSVEIDSADCSATTLGCGFTGSAAPAAILPPMPSGASASCLVRFHAQPGADLSSVAASVGGYIENAQTHGLMNDDDPGNDVVPLDLAPEPRGHSAHGRRGGGDSRSE